MAKKRKTKAGKLFKKLWGEVKDLGKGIGRGFHKIGDAYVDVASFVVLAPFKPAMKKALDKKGIKHTNRLSDIAPKFVKNVVQSNKNYENYQGDLKHYEEYEALENLELLEQYELYWANGEVANLLEGEAVAVGAEGAKIGGQVVSSIIKAVIDFFGNILRKKKEGKPLTDDEQKLAEIAEKGATVADDLIRAEATQRTGEFVMDNRTILIIVAVILAYFVFIRRR